MFISELMLLGKVWIFLSPRPAMDDMVQQLLAFYKHGFGIK